MAEPKVLNTRIQLRFDTLTNWEAAVTAKPKKIILEKGEVAIAQINKVMPPPPDVKEVSTKSTTVEYMMKVGDGSTAFEDLPWFSAKAADVYEWAKADGILGTAPTTDDAVKDGSYGVSLQYDATNRLRLSRAAFDTSITDSASNINAPTTKAVKNYVDTTIDYAVPDITVKEATAPTMVKGTTAVISKITPDGHTLTVTRTLAATKEYVDGVVAGAVQYWGVIDKPEDLGKDMTISGTPVVTVGKGDFYRVGAQFSTYAVGDLLIANTDNAGATEDNYHRLKQENGDGTVTSITAGDGLTGGEITSSGTIAHAVPSGAAAGAKGTGTASDRKYLKSVTTDKFGHVTGFTEGTETVVDTNRAIKVGGVEKLTASDKSAIDFINGTNTTVVYDNSKKTIKINAVDTIPNNGKFTVSGGNGLTGSGSMTANQASATSATLAVGAGNGITVATDSVSVTDYDNILTAKGTILATEKGVSIILCGGDSNI